MPPTVDNVALLGEWGDWMGAQDLASRTQELYTTAIYRLLSRSFTRGKGLLELTETELVAHLAAFGSRAHSKRQHRQAVKSFYGWACRRRYMEHNPALILDGGKRPRRSPPAPFTPEELTRLLIAAAWRHPRRAWAMLACFSLGTRRTEFMMLRPQDIDWERRVVRLWHDTKGDKHREVDVSPLAEVALRELLALMRPNAYGTVVGVKPGSLTDWVNRAAQDCGFPEGRKRRAHTLRSTFATNLGHAGVPPEVIRDLLGHESISTTNLYLGSHAGDGARAVQTFGLDFGRVSVTKA